MRSRGAGVLRASICLNPAADSRCWHIPLHDPASGSVGQRATGPCL